MGKLDDLNFIKTLDKSNVVESINLLDKQCLQVKEEIKKIKLPVGYKKVTSIVVNGMGGSALGSHIIRSLYADGLKIPLRIIHSYELPASVDSKTLFLASSYSGNTEEIIPTIKAALKKKAKVLIVAGGGELAKIKAQHKIPGYIFEPKYNPCNQPRMGLGYSILSQWLLFAKLGLIKFDDKQFEKIIGTIRTSINQFGLEQQTPDNPAKLAAEKLVGKIPVVVSAEFLSGNAHTLANQFNENSKNFAVYYLISEMNHHLLEGLAHPQTNQMNLMFLFLESRLFYERNQKRFSITKEILSKNQVGFSSYLLKSDDKFCQSFEFLVFGSFLSLYLAILNNVNPSLIPWVDYFKEQLK